MSTVAMASSLNPNAPLFIPAAYRQVEDFSPEWWDLVHTTAWFRDHWFRQHHHHHHQRLHEGPHHHHDAALPDDDDLFYAPDHHLQMQYHQEPSSDADAVLLRTLALASPRGAPWDHHHQTRHADKPAAQHVGITDDADARRFIHQPR